MWICQGYQHHKESVFMWPALVALQITFRTQSIRKIFSLDVQLEVEHDKQQVSLDLE